VGAAARFRREVLRRSGYERGVWELADPKELEAHHLVKLRDGGTNDPRGSPQPGQASRV
jgi:hypothetical protein